jgi:hypothetical protein
MKIFGGYRHYVNLDAGKATKGEEVQPISLYEFFEKGLSKINTST